MTARALVVALVGAACGVAGSGSVIGQETVERALSFEETVEALVRSPRFERMAAELAAAQARLVTATTYPHNPILEVEGADRDAADGSTTDRIGRLGQRFELGGQRSRRRQRAEGDLAAARASLERGRRTAIAEGALAFARAVHRREVLALEETEAELARAFADIVERRLEAGAATVLERALAQAGLAGAERGLALARGAYLAARARLAELVGTPAAREDSRPVTSEAVLVVPTGELPEIPEPLSHERAFAQALEGRSDLFAAAARQDAAEAAVALARAERLPDLTAALFGGREEGDDVAGLELSLPLPLFERNQGGIAEAEAGFSAARASRALKELEVRREVAAAHGRLSAALEARELARRFGVTPLEEGLGMLERSFDAGKIGAAELLLYRRELVEGRRQALEADLEAWEAAVELALAVGEPLPGIEWEDGIEGSGAEPERSER